MTVTDSTPALHPECLWAQRTNEIFLTINLPDVNSPKLKLTPTSISFDGMSKDKHYAVEFEFFKEIIPEESKQSISGRNMFFVLVKKEKDQEYWPRMIKSSKKPFYLKTDFAKWKDEDEEEEEEGPAVDMPTQNFDLSQLMQMSGGAMGGMGGMGGAGGFGGFGAGSGSGSTEMNFEEADSDDEELPPLEDAE